MVSLELQFCPWTIQLCPTPAFTRGEAGLNDGPAATPSTKAAPSHVLPWRWPDRPSGLCPRSKETEATAEADSPRESNQAE